MASRILGVGSPLVDLLAHVDDAFLQTHVPGGKGGMEMVEAAWQRELIGRLGGGVERAPGGSAGNTVFALARMGVPCAMLGKLGQDDDGRFYREQFAAYGGSAEAFIETADAPTGNCLALITDDAERTMRSALGASLLLNIDEVEAFDYSPYHLVYIEGYMLFSEVFEPLLRRAKAAGCRIGLDLASFEVVRHFRDRLPALLEQYVDIVFANSDEARELCGEAPPEEQLERLGECCEVAVVKLGAEGSLVRCGGETLRVAAVPVENPVDTTAAGDLYAAGFLYGIASGMSPARCAGFGSFIASEVVRVVGSALPREAWSRVEREFEFEGGVSNEI